MRRIWVTAIALTAGLAVALPSQAAEPSASAPTASAAAAKRCKTTTKKGVKTRTCTVRGARGRRGAQGVQGPKGDTGVIVSQGTTGATGPQGPTGAQGPAGPAGPAGGSGTTVFAEAGAGTVTDDFNYEQVAGGPTVTVTVPPSGNIIVAASIRTDGEVAVALFEDGTNVSEAECLFPGGPSIFESLGGGPGGLPSMTWGTPAGFACGSPGSPGGVMLHTTPGTHTYELRYGACGCSVPENIDQRRLWITTLP